MGWLQSLFGGPSTSSANARRKMTLSTHDAFSLPTSSPVTASHPDAFTRRSPDMLEDGVLTPSTSSYAYPPATSPTTYDYPRTNGRLLASDSRQNSLLPLHNNAPLSPLSPPPPYPPLERTWARLQKWLAKEYPELGDTLNYGILPQDLEEIEMALGFALPNPVRESYLIADGQEAESSAGCSEGLFFGLTFLPLEDVLDEWRFWREVDSDPATGANAQLSQVMTSIPPGFVRKAYSQRGWIPLVTDKTGNYLGIDLSPDEKGSVGQVIVFGRDFDTKVVMWRGDGPAGWATWFSGFVDDLESGEGYELGQISDGSEGSEDDVGYESYFFDGSGRQKGEGGDDSGGGPRLNGEYRGWNVLEAWADKSVKRWRDAGLLPEVSAESSQKAKGTKHGLGVLNLASKSTPSDAEVPIPVLETNNPDEATPTIANNEFAEAGPSKVLPIISVTKPPAPRPVILPSPQDFQSPSPTDSRATSFDIDLERGRQLSMDEVEHPLSGATVAVKPPSPTTPTAVRRHNESVSTVKEATLVQIPLEEEPIPEKPADDLMNENESAAVPIAPIEPVTTPVSEQKSHTSLLVDEEPVASNSSDEKTLTDINPSETEKTMNDELAASEETKEVDTKEVETKEVELKEVSKGSSDNEEEEELPEQTVRLVGGGGVVTVGPEPELEEDKADVASISSVTSARTSTDADGSKVKGKHAKKKSFGLKRISKLGGNDKRRSDSKESISLS